jgi:hypothetical protein
MIQMKESEMLLIDVIKTVRNLLRLYGADSKVVTTYNKPLCDAYALLQNTIDSEENIMSDVNNWPVLILSNKDDFERVGDYISILRQHWERETKAASNAELEAKIKGLELRIDVDTEIINNYRSLMKLIPECKLHGPTCIPHAKEWLGQVKTVLDNAGTLKDGVIK